MDGCDLRPFEFYCFIMTLCSAVCKIRIMSVFSHSEKAMLAQSEGEDGLVSLRLR